MDSESVHIIAERLSLKSADLTDLAALKILEEECDRYFAFDPPDEHNHVCSIEECLRNGDLPPGGIKENYHFLKILYKETLIGFAAYYLGYRRRDNAYLSVLYIGEKQRRSGFGAEAVRHLLERLYSCAMRTVCLHVSLRNTTALAFWVRQGFDRIVEVQCGGNLVPGAFAGIELQHTGTGDRF